MSSPLLVRLLLRWLPLGTRRDEIASDVLELFDTRRRTRGVLHAYGRLAPDLVSVLTAPFEASAPAAERGRHVQMSTWLVDLRHGVRLFRRNPGVIGATVGGLALAIAVCTTVFTIVNVGFLRPYGMRQPSSVVRVQMLVDHGVSTGWPFHAFADLRERVGHLELAANLEERVAFARASSETPPHLDSLMLVSGNYLPMLGARAVVGRTLAPADDESGATPVVVLNHRFWATRLGADPSIVGRSVWLSGHAVTVVGVLDSSFTGPVDTPPAIWAPFGSYAAIFADRPFDRTTGTPVAVIGRVADRVDRRVAEQELSATAAALPDAGIRTESGGMRRATGVRLDRASSPLDDSDSTSLLIVLAIILLLVGLVLALACANVANLLLAGAATRAREIGVRIALGASRQRILRQLLSESLMIGVTAGVAGLVLSLWLVPIVGRAVGLADTYEVTPDTTVLVFTAAIAVLAGVLAGLAPARYGAGGDVLGALNSQGPHASPPPKANRLRRVFTGFQAAASILLLVTATLFARAALHIVHVDLGFDADRLAVVSVAFPSSGFDVPAMDAYWRTAMERLRAFPLVERAALTHVTPLGNDVTLREVPRLERGGVPYRIAENRTDADYFAAGGFHILRGRAYSADEVRAHAPVAVVSESIARDFFAGRDPIGASLSAVAPDLASITIIGVVKEAVTLRIQGHGNGAIDRPLAAADGPDVRVLVRAAQPALIARDLEKTLVAVDPRVRPTATLLRADVDRFVNQPKVLAGLSGALAGLALILAILGLYGVTTFVVGQRLWEMHVRQAIGASTADIARLLVRQSLTPVTIGLAAGLAVALMAARVLTPGLMGLSPYDPVAIVGAVVVLLATATAAVMLPTLRAARANPAAVLRQG